MLLKTGTIRETIPVQVVVGANVFKPIALLTFSKSYDGANPTYQVITVASTATNFNFIGLEASATGGNWLTITPSNYGSGLATPQSVQVSVNPTATLAPGSYIGEILFTSAAGDQGMVVPVTLIVDSSSAAAAPTFTPPAGSYTVTQTVTIKGSARGSAVHYTLNGTTPTASSPVYSVPLSVTATETIKAIEIAPGFPDSAVATAVYTITAPKAATPAVTQMITIAEATAGATVYYTTNGSTPTTSSTNYTAPIALTASETLKFIAVAPGFAQSAVRTVTVTVQ